MVTRKVPWYRWTFSLIWLVLTVVFVLEAVAFFRRSCTGGREPLIIGIVFSCLAIFFGVMEWRTRGPKEMIRRWGRKPGEK